MIITRTPLRICLGGGGTDVKDYYKRFGGHVISAAINQYIYVVVHNSFDKSIRICYSKREIVDTADEVRHPVVREAIKLFKIKESGLEILSFADIPAETGMGSSSTFTTGLVTALAAYQGLKMTRYELAEMACHIERELLNEAGGKQDQYIAAFGGISRLIFEQNGRVLVSPVQISHEDIQKLERSILLFYTGIKRNSPKMQRALIRGVKKETRTLESLHEIKRLGIETEELLCNGQIDHYAELLNQHWELKKKLSDAITNGRINHFYETAKQYGAMGGKLIGAGGGGYLLLFCTDDKKREQLISRLEQEGLEQLRFRFDFTGATVLVDDGIRNKFGVVVAV